MTPTPPIPLFCRAAVVLAGVFALAGIASAQELAPTSDTETRVDAPQSEQSLNDEIGNTQVSDIEDIPLSDLLDMVVTATKGAISSAEAPAVIDVVGHAEIRRRGYRTVADAISRLAGIYVIDDHTTQNVGIRGVFGSAGSANDNVKVMINGQSTSFRSTQTSFLGYDLIPIEAVDRIEVLRGPASALYGANALMGVINVITYKGKVSENSQRPNYSVTGDGYVLQNDQKMTGNGAVGAMAADSIGKLEYMAAAQFHYSNRSGLTVPGFSDIAQDNLHRLSPDIYPGSKGYPSPGWDVASRSYMLAHPTSRNDIERTASAYGIAKYALTDTLALQLDVHGTSFDKGAEWQDFSFLTGSTRLTYLNGYARLQLLYGANRVTGWSGKVSVTFAGGKPTSSERITDRLVAGSYKRRDVGYRALDAVVEARYAFTARDSLTFGADLTEDRENLLTLDVIDAATKAETGDAGAYGTRNFNNVGVYAQLLVNPLERLLIAVAARGDYNSQVACARDVWECVGSRGDRTFASPVIGNPPIIAGNRGLAQISTHAAAVYSLPWWEAHLKLIYGTSFKPPTPYQLYHTPLTITGSGSGNPGLLPSTATTYEVALDMEPVKGLRTVLVAEYTKVEDSVINFYEQGRITNRNATVAATGLEGSVNWAATDRLTLSGNGTVTLGSSVKPAKRPDETAFAFQSSPYNTSVPVDRYPKWMANIAANLASPESHININAVVGYVGTRRSSLTNTQLSSDFDLSKNYNLKGYVRADLTVSSMGLYWLSDKLETVIAISARNIPGHYVDPGNGIDIPSLGSTFMAHLTQAL